MANISRNVIILCCFLLMVNCKNKIDDSKIEALESSEKWMPLFNGKDLNDWHVKIKGFALNENIHNTFRVEDGVLKVSYDGYKTFDENYGHIFYKNPFSSYKLRVDYRFTGQQFTGAAGWAERNSGLMIHCQDPKTMAIEQKFPLCIEVQMLGGITEGQPRPTGNLCTPGSNVVMNDQLVTEHCISSSSETYYGEQWVNLEVEVYSDSLIRHKINGKEVMSYTKPQIGGGDMDDYSSEYKTKLGELIKGGYISLQSESHPVEFRKIELLNLDHE